MEQAPRVMFLPEVRDLLETFSCCITPNPTMAVAVVTVGAKTVSCAGGHGLRICRFMNSLLRFARFLADAWTCGLKG